MQSVDTCAVRFDYLGYNRTGYQVAVRVAAIGPSVVLGASTARTPAGK